MKVFYSFLFTFVWIIGFSQNRVTHSYKFSIQSITSYSQAKPYYDQIRLIFSESKSVNHILMFDSSEATFKVQSTIQYDRSNLSLELKKIGLVLTDLIIDGSVEE